MSDELRPCPFCGGKARVFVIDKTEGLRTMYDFARPYHRIVCQGGCGCIMGDFGNRQEAIDHWNRRSVTAAAVYGYMAAKEDA